MDKEPNKPLLPFVMVFGGCGASLIFMEYVLKGDDNAGNFLNATEFVFVLLQSIPGRIDARTMKLRPLRASWGSHLQHALLWVAMSTLANVVFAFNIRIPIHTLFRSCNVIASVVLGRLFFQQQYTIRQLCCVAVISVGIFLASIGDASKIWTLGGCVDCGQTQASQMSSKEFNVWSMGIAMLACVQLLQATLGHTQAVLYTRFADRGTRDELADEYLFTSHVLSLVMIVVLWEDISSSAKLAFATPGLTSWLPLPRRLAWMMLNNLSQLMCIKGVFRLSANYSPLTVTIVLSVRKFLSVVISATWFGNPWTYLHSIATVAIFGGVFMYSQSPRPEKKTD